MSNEVKINIERTGFPVKIGTVELWFDSSIESLLRFKNVDTLKNEKLKEVEEKAKHIHFPDDVTDMNVENIDMKTVDAVVDYKKEAIAAEYDIIFGDGTFKKIYKKYPDIMALEKALEVVGTAIAQRIEEVEQERMKKAKAKQTEYLAKKVAKKK